MHKDTQEVRMGIQKEKVKERIDALVTERDFVSFLVKVYSDGARPFEEVKELEQLLKKEKGLDYTDFRRMKSEARKTVKMMQGGR